MAGNILYIPYTFFIILGLIVVSFVIRFKIGKLALKKFLTIAIPIVMFIQFYFWNIEFNIVVKSYVFNSNVYECKYEDELKDLSIPLPNRTVLRGKEDACDPFYTTFVDDKEFVSFYDEELENLEKRGIIESYTYIEKDATNKGYIVELTSGSDLDLLIRKYEDSDQWMISIGYNPEKV